jgi:hypothetical protein
MCVNGSSDIASIYSQQGKKGVNQDCMVVWEVFGYNFHSFYTLGCKIQIILSVKQLNEEK